MPWPTGHLAGVCLIVFKVLVLTGNDTVSYAYGAHHLLKSALYTHFATWQEFEHFFVNTREDPPFSSTQVATIEPGFKAIEQVPDEKTNREVSCPENPGSFLEIFTDKVHDVLLELMNLSKIYYENWFCLDSLIGGLNITLYIAKNHSLW